LEYVVEYYLDYFFKNLQHETMTNLEKAKSLYYTRQMEYEKAKDAALKAELDTPAGGLSKAERKRRTEEDAMHRVGIIFIKRTN